jgi:hypothetical protein
MHVGNSKSSEKGIESLIAAEMMNRKAATGATGEGIGEASVPVRYRLAPR